MFKKIMLSIVVYILFSSCSAYSAQPEIGRCYMGSCSWSVIIKKEVVAAKNNAVLYKTTLVGGDSSHKSIKDYPRNYSKNLRIKWDNDTHNVYVLCYSSLPVVVIGKQYSVIDFNNVPGVLESDASLYVRVCYGEPGTKAFSPNFVNEKNFPHPLLEEVNVTSPEELLRYVK